MGTYCTTTSLETVMIGTVFDTATTAMASKMIDNAENEVDKYISKRYDISASTFQTSTGVPPLLTSLAETLAEGYIRQRNARGGKEQMAFAKQLIDQAIDNLKLIADYKLDLVATNGSVIPDMSNTAYKVHSTTDQYSSTFNEDSELKWKVDPDKLADISDERDS